MATVTKAVSTEFDTSGGALGRWTNPSNVFATTGDNVYATAVPPKNGEIQSGFGVGFTTSDIPDGSTLNSITATVEWKLSALVTGGQLYLAHGGSAGDRTSVTKTTTAEAQDTVVFSPGPGFPTLANLRTAATAVSDQYFLRALCDKGNTNSALTGSIDFISVTVDFTAPRPLPILVTAPHRAP